MSNIFKGLVTEKKKKPKPTSPEKWARAKAKARSKFDVYPSAYANAYASKEYKKMGGGWRMGESIIDLDENLLNTYADMFNIDEEDLAEMDKSAPQPGRDGKVSHSTYGSRDKKGSDYFKGKEAPGKPITAKQAAKDALDILKKQGVAEAQGDTLMDPEMALPQARRITKAIKYDDTIGEIITQIQMLAERTEGIDSKTLEYSIDGVLAAKNALESAVYDLEEAFEDAARNQQYKRDEEDLGEDYTGMFAAEKTPAINPYGGAKDRQFRGAISETPTDNPTGSSGEGGWRTYKAKSAGTFKEDTAYAGGMGQGGNAGQSYRKFKPKSAGTFKEEQLDEKCWDGYKQVGGKMKGGKMVPNCVPKESAIMKGLNK